MHFAFRMYTNKKTARHGPALPSPAPPFFFSPSYLVDPLRPSVLLLCLKSCDQLAPRRPVLKPGLSMSYWVPNQQKKILAVRLLANWIGRWLPPPNYERDPAAPASMTPERQREQTYAIPARAAEALPLSYLCIGSYFLLFLRE